MDYPTHRAETVHLHAKNVYVQTDRPVNSDLNGKLDKLIEMMTLLLSQGNSPVLKNLADRLDKKSGQLQQATDDATPVKSTDPNEGQ